MSLIPTCAVQMQLSDQARRRVASQSEPRAAVGSLLEAGLHRDALALALRLLPPPYAVAWLCQCARASALDKSDEAGLRLAQRWVQQADDANWRAAASFAEENDYLTAGAWLAASAAWAHPEPMVENGAPPAEHLTATAGVAALLHLAGRVPDTFDARIAQWARDAASLLDGPGQAAAGARMRGANNG